MNQWLKILGIASISLLLTAFTLPTYAKVSTALHPVTWQGKKWEYLVEHPTDVQAIDPVRFEEILDTVGHHGWHLVTVTNSFNFYAFYFERELLPHKLTEHRERLRKIKAVRKAKETATQAQLEEAHLEKLRRARNAQTTAERKTFLQKKLMEQHKYLQQVEQQ